MNENLYRKISEPIKASRNGVKIINLLNKLSTGLVYITYPVILLWLAYMKDSMFLPTLLVPAVSFIILSIFRSYINFSRPYELLDIEPIINKSTAGNSFPSRHVFSVFVIAMTIYYISKPIGIGLMIVGLLISLIRVVGGVHFPRDVIAGAIIGILSAIIGYNILT